MADEGEGKRLRPRSNVDRRQNRDPIADRPENFMEAWRRAQAEYEGLKTRGPDRRLVRAAKVFEAYIQGANDETDLR